MNFMFLMIIILVLSPIGAFIIQISSYWQLKVKPRFLLCLKIFISYSVFSALLFQAVTIIKTNQTINSNNQFGILELVTGAISLFILLLIYKTFIKTKDNSEISYSSAGLIVFNQLMISFVLYVMYILIADFFFPTHVLVPL